MLTHPTGLFRETIFRPLWALAPQIFTRPTSPINCISSRTWTKSIKYLVNKNQIMNKSSAFKSFKDNFFSVLGFESVCHFLLVSHWIRAPVFNGFRGIRPPIPVYTYATHTDTGHTPQVILCSVPCDVLHGTDNDKMSLLGRPER